MAKTVNDYMTMPMKDWPEALQNYVMAVGKLVGHSGGVFSDCAEQYIAAGEPTNADGLINAFYTRLNRVYTPATEA